MATGSVSRNGMGIARGSCGTATGDGTALSVTLGFKPKHVIIYNETDAMRWEKFFTQVDANSVKTVTAGTQTTDTTSAIVLAEKGFVTSAALAANGKVLHWFAE